MTMDPSRPVAPSAKPESEARPTWSPAEPAPAVAPVAPVVAVAPRRKSGGILNVLLVGAAILAIGGVAFAVGRTTAPATAFAGVGGVPGGGGGIRPGGSFAPGAGGPGGFGQGGGSVSLDGTVTAIDAGSLTVTLSNGTERTFTLDASTTYREATDTTADTVAVGDNVSVKVAGGGRVPGGAAASTAPDLTASDVTVAR